MKKIEYLIYTKEVEEEVRKANAGACGLFHSCGELVKSTK